MKRKTTAVDVVLAVISVALLVGSFTFLRTCSAKADGSFMYCHWAGQAIKGVSCVIAVLSIINIFVKNSGIKIGLNFSIVLNCLLNALIPGVLIKTCMMADMRCNAVTTPGVSVFCVAIAILALAEIIINRGNLKNES